MRTVVAYELLSLDGVAESPDRFFGWDDVLDANLGHVIATQDTVILGRRSYDEWAPYWPASDLQPFADFITAVPKCIATSTPLSPAWNNATTIEGDLVAAVRELKAQPGGDIGIHASISVVRTLLAAGAVDELRLVIAPSIIGSGQRLLEGVPLTTLEVMRSEMSPTGHLMLDYRVLPRTA